jgi:monoamine oxidase
VESRARTRGRLTAPSVIVVGAGAAGLMAARELRRASCKVVVLEASDRVGGRIHTLYDTGAGIPIELGAEFIHGEAPETNRLLAEARLVTVPVMGKHYRSDRGELSPQERTWERMARVFKRIDPDRKLDRSFQEFLDGKPGARRLERDRELALGFVQGFYAADPSLISEKSLAQQGDPTEGAAEAARIVNGYASLIAHLHRDLEDVVHLKTVVNRILWDESGVRVLARNGGEYSARAVVITVPLSALQDESLAIEPEIPATRKAARQLVMGHAARVSVVVKERFWEKKVDAPSFVHTPKRPFNVWWTMYPLLAPVIVGWSGGPPAVELTRSGEIESAAVRELARAFGTRRDRLESLIESVHPYDWTHDPLARGAYSYVGVGGIGAAKRLSRPVSGSVFFAGEATDEENGSTVEGALASGKRAARQVLRALE